MFIFLAQRFKFTIIITLYTELHTKYLNGHNYSLHKILCKVNLPAIYENFTPLTVFSVHNYGSREWSTRAAERACARRHHNLICRTLISSKLQAEDIYTDTIHQPF